MKVILKMKALEPISVGYESIGIETLLYSIPIIQEDGSAIDVPIIPGNSLRGVLRDQMTLQFLEDLKMAIEKNREKNKKPNNGQYTLSAHVGTLLSLFSGGILSGEEKSDGSKEPNIKEIMDNYVYPLLPLSIMGVALKKIIIPGKIKVGIGYPVTEETRHLLVDLGVALDRDIPTLPEIVSSVLITRKDDTNKVMQLNELLDITGEPKDIKAEDSAIQQRLYRQVVVPGTTFYSYIEDVIPMTEAEWGLILKTLERLDKIGGRIAGGLGKIKLQVEGIEEGKRNELIQKYDEYIEQNLKKILEALGKNPNDFFKNSSKEQGRNEEQTTNEE
ncbi:RAMP superfamily CRISPR-associated protein [Thermococcus sp. GR6]|uniref:RAMP superfamily CRISPR-associated protein n=1 Tax=Thermococcus sp. GR6 TaxID=1638256 RepID=UPI001430367A|nr:RAMP superfamily CRISPR-associated protein [Thermococcus sp. GR6]NJE42475.1 hypothetical protein [Thermococcus sp. GR6]